MEKIKPRENIKLSKEKEADLETVNKKADLLISQITELEKKAKTKEDYKELTKLYQEIEELYDPKEKLESSFQEQYKTQIEILERTGILQELKSHEKGIKAIDGQEYPIPTQAEIATRIEAKKELIEKKQEQGFTKLLIVPFGMELNDLIEKYQQVILKHHKDKKLFATKKNPEEEDELLELDEKEPVWAWDNYKDADLNGKLVYFPKELSENHEGKTKREIISEQGGWQVILVEDMPNIPREGKGVTIKNRKQFEAGATPNDYLKELKEKDQYHGESGMTPEEQIIYGLTHLEEKNQVVDDWQGNGSVSYQLGAYFVSGVVPGAVWFRGGRRVGLGGRDPGGRDDFCGVRSAVRT